MRTIKFKGKDIETGKWVYGFYVRLEDSSRKPIDGKERISHRIYTGFADSCASQDGYDFSGDWHEVDPGTIGQFTGYYDSKGNEIFEGDITTRIRELLDRTGSIEQGKIEWRHEEGCYLFVDRISTRDNRELVTPLIRCKRIMVIGNIYDNPKLMEGAKP